MLVQDDRLVLLPDGLRDGLAIKWRATACAGQEFDIDSIFAQNVGGFKRGVDHRSVSNDAEVAAFADDVRLANRDNIILGGDFPFDAAIENLCLKKMQGLLSRTAALIRPLAS